MPRPGDGPDRTARENRATGAGHGGNLHAAPQRRLTAPVRSSRRRSPSSRHWPVHRCSAAGLVGRRRDLWGRAPARRTFRRRASSALGGLRGRRRGRRGARLGTPEPAAFGIGALLGASLIAERYPVPLDGIDAGGLTLTFAFGVAAITLFGWAAGVAVFFTAPAAMQLLEHRPWSGPRSMRHSSASPPRLPAGSRASSRGSSSAATFAAVAVAATAHYAVNVILITAVVSRSAGRPFFAAIRNASTSPRCRSRSWPPPRSGSSCSGSGRRCS